MPDLPLTLISNVTYPGNIGLICIVHSYRKVPDRNNLMEGRFSSLVVSEGFSPWGGKGTAQQLSGVGGESMGKAVPTAVVSEAMNQGLDLNLYKHHSGDLHPLIKPCLPCPQNLHKLCRQLQKNHSKHEPVRDISDTKRNSNRAGGNHKLLITLQPSIDVRKQLPFAAQITMGMTDRILYTCTFYFIYRGHKIDICSPGNKAFCFALEFIFNCCWKPLSQDNVHSPLMLSLQLGRLPGIRLPDTKSIWCMTKIKPPIAWK